MQYITNLTMTFKIFKAISHAILVVFIKLSIMVDKL